MGIFTSSLPSFAAFQKGRASSLQTMADCETALTAAWTNYTPTWAGITLGNAVVLAKYRQLGKTVDVRVQATMGTTTTYGAAIITATLPVTALDTANQGAGYIFDSGVGQRSGTSALLSTTTAFIIIASTNAATPATPITWSTGDIWSFTMTYEAA